MESSRRCTPPGPGAYNLTSWRNRSNPWYTPPIVVCFCKGADTCSGCKKLLFGDYYKSSSGKVSLCLPCFRKVFDPIRRKPGNFYKMRHCIVYHKHIDVENIVFHKMTSKQTRRVHLMEKRMWNKFGDVSDHLGRPV